MHVAIKGWVHHGPSLSFLMDASGEEFVDVTMARQWLAHPSDRVLIPIVSHDVANEHAARGGELLNQLDALRGTWNWATLRTHGIAPLVTSAQMTWGHLTAGLPAGDDSTQSVDEKAS